MKQVWLLFAVLISSCATLYGENDREIHITSVPSGAMVYMNGVNYGKTPMSLVLPSVGYFGQKITLTKPGYKNQVFEVQTKFQNVGYWNIIVFPVFLVDLGTGYMYKIKPGAYDFNIQLESMASTTHIPESQIMQIIPSESGSFNKESK